MAKTQSPRAIRKTVSLGTFLGHPVRLDCRFDSRRNWQGAVRELKFSFKEVIDKSTAYAATMQLLRSRSSELANARTEALRAEAASRSASKSARRSRRIGRAWMVACLITWAALAVSFAL